jgi:hypothetical protein
VIYSESVKGLDVRGRESTLPLYVTKQLHTLYGKDAYRPENEQDLPPPVFCVGATVIEIKSRPIIHALQTVIGYYPDLSLTGDTVRIHEPYAPLYHYRQELLEYHDQLVSATRRDDCQEDETLPRDIKLLLDLFEELWGQRVRDELERYDRPAPTCSYDMLWMLYKPGLDVYVDFLQSKVYDAFVFRSLEVDFDSGTATHYKIDFWCMQGDTVYVGPGRAEFKSIRPFAGEKEIADLAIFPCKFMTAEKHGTTHDVRHEQLVKRGEMFFHLMKGVQYMSFDGKSADWPPRTYRGRVMVDMEESVRDLGEHPERLGEIIELASDVEMSNVVTPRCGCPNCIDLSRKRSQARIQFAGYSNINPLKVEALTEHQNFLCCRSVNAYILKHRQWSKKAVLRIEKCSRAMN